MDDAEKHYEGDNIAIRLGEQTALLLDPSPLVQPLVNRRVR